jgi:hypothetical protein
VSSRIVATRGLDPLGGEHRVVDQGLDRGASCPRRAPDGEQMQSPATAAGDN